MANISQIKVSGTNFPVALPYCECATGAATAAKVANLNGFSLSTGTIVQVKFTYENTASTPTLNINGTGNIAIKAYGTTAPSISWKAGSIIEFTYDGTNYIMTNFGALATGSASPASSLSGSSASASLNGTTITLSKSISNTPNVSAGYIASGTSGNTAVSVSGTVPTETKTATSNGDVTPSTGKLLSKVTVAIPTTVLDNSIIAGQAIEEAAGDYAWQSTVTIPAGMHGNQTLTKTFSEVFPAPATPATSAQMQLGYQAYNKSGVLMTGTMPEVTPAFTGGTASVTGTSNAISVSGMATTTATTSYAINATAKAKATRTAVTYNGDAKGHININSGTTASASSTSSESSISAATIYIPAGGCTVAGGGLSQGTASGGGLSGGDISGGDISGGGLSGGGLTAGAGEVTITQQPAVTPAITGSVISTGTTTYGVTTTKPSGTDGTNFLTLDPDASYSQQGKAKGRGTVSRATITRATITRATITRASVTRAAFSQSVTRADITDAHTAGYIPAKTATTVISSGTSTVSLAAGTLAAGTSAATTSAATTIAAGSATSNYSSESSTSGTVNAGTNYYVPIVTASATAGTATATATISKAPTATTTDSSATATVTGMVTTTTNTGYSVSASATSGSASAASGVATASSSAAGGSASVGKGITSGATASGTSTGTKSATTTEQTASSSAKSASTTTYIQKGVLSAGCSTTSGSASVSASGFSFLSSGTSSYKVTLSTTSGSATGSASVGTEGYVKSETASSGAKTVTVSGATTKYIPAGSATGNAGTITYKSHTQNSTNKKKFTVTGTVTAPAPSVSAGYVSSGTAGTSTDRTVSLTITDAQAQAAVGSGSVTISDSTLTVSPSVTPTAVASAAGNISLGTATVTVPSSGYYISATGGNSATTGSATSGESSTVTKTAGYISAGTNTITSTGTATANASSKTVYYPVTSGTITNNTSGGTSSGTINRGNQIKIGAGYYGSDAYYTAQANSGTKTISSSGTTSVDGYANASVAAGALSSGSGSASLSGSNVTLSDTDNGISVTATGSGSVSVGTAGYLASGTSKSSNSATATKYISEITVPSDKILNIINSSGYVNVLGPGSVSAACTTTTVTDTVYSGSTSITAYYSGTSTGSKAVTSGGNWVQNTVTPSTSAQGPYYGRTTVNAITAGTIASDVSFTIMDTCPQWLGTAGWFGDTGYNYIQSVNIASGKTFTANCNGGTLYATPSGTTLGGIVVNKGNGSLYSLVTVAGTSSSAGGGIYFMTNDKYCTISTITNRGTISNIIMTDTSASTYQPQIGTITTGYYGRINTLNIEENTTYGLLTLNVAGSGDNKGGKIRTINLEDGPTTQEDYYASIETINVGHNGKIGTINNTDGSVTINNSKTVTVKVPTSSYAGTTSLHGRIGESSKFTQVSPVSNGKWGKDPGADLSVTTVTGSTASGTDYIYARTTAGTVYGSYSTSSYCSYTTTWTYTSKSLGSSIGSQTILSFVGSSYSTIQIGLASRTDSTPSSWVDIPLTNGCVTIRLIRTVTGTGGIYIMKTHPTTKLSLT